MSLFLSQAPSPPAPQLPQPAPTPSPDIAPPAIPAPTGVWRVPQSAAEQAILDAQRAILSAQIENVRSRRAGIARAYERASGASRAGLEQQLRALDQRILQMEQDLAESGKARYQSNYVPTTGVGPGRFLNITPGQTTAISIVFIVAVLGPLAASFGRMMWRRSTRLAAPPGWNDATQRLERLEQSIDAIAIEMERVSEGQRFMTKIMTQNPSARPNANQAGQPEMNGGQPLPALGPGLPEPVILQNQRDEVRVRRS